MRKKSTIVLVICYVLVLLSACGIKTIPLDISDMEKIEDVMEISFEDYWVAKKNALEYSQAYDKYMAGSYELNAYSDFLEDKRADYMNYSEEEAKEDYIKYAVITNRAIELGFDIESASPKKFIPVELGLDKSIRHEKEYIEKITEQAQKKNMTYKEYVDACIRPVYRTLMAETILLSIYYTKECGGERPLGMDEAEKAIKVHEAFNQYVDELVEEAKAQKGS